MTLSRGWPFALISAGLFATNLTVVAAQATSGQSAPAQPPDPSASSAPPSTAGQPTINVPNPGNAGTAEPPAQPQPAAAPADVDPAASIPAKKTYTVPA